jgi:hypothetical protein
LAAEPFAANEGDSGCSTDHLEIVLHRREVRALLKHREQPASRSCRLVTEIETGKEGPPCIRIVSHMSRQAPYTARPMRIAFTR